MKKEMSARDISELAEALLNCGTVSSRHTRDMIVNSLPESVRTGIVREDEDKTDVANIIRNCMDFEDGLIKLVATVKHFEGNTIWMKQVNKVLPKFFSDTEEHLPRLLSSKPPLWIDKEQYEFFKDMAPSRKKPVSDRSGEKKGNHGEDK